MSKSGDAPIKDSSNTSIFSKRITLKPNTILRIEKIAGRRLNSHPDTVINSALDILEKTIRGMRKK